MSVRVRRLILGAVAALVFALLWLAVDRGLTAGFDRRGLMALALGDHRGGAGSIADLITVAQALSLMGEPPVRVFVVGVALAAALLKRRWRSGLVMAAAVLTTAGLTDLIKGWMARPRPRLVPWLDDPTSFSFPSGHASGALTVALAVGLSLPPGRGRTWVLGLGLPLALAIGLSRPMLGVHWPTDTLAGWALGVAVVMFAFGALGEEGQAGQRGRSRPANRPPASRPAASRPAGNRRRRG